MYVRVLIFVAHKLSLTQIVARASRILAKKISKNCEIICDEASL